MALRRYTPLKSGRGMVIPSTVRNYVRARDNGCVMAHIVPGHQCSGGIELDHVRASGGIGMKSPSTADNLVSMCSLAHRFKTENGRLVRPWLLSYLERVEPSSVVDELDRGWT